MAGPGCWTGTNHIHLAYVKSRRRTGTVVLTTELKPVHVAAVLTLLSLSEFPTKDEDSGVDEGHSAADLGLKLALDIVDRQPGGGLEVDEPEIIKHGLFWRGATVDEDMSVRKSQ